MIRRFVAIEPLVIVEQSRLDVFSSTNALKNSMSWQKILPKARSPRRRRHNIPEGVWTPVYLRTGALPGRTGGAISSVPQSVIIICISAPPLRLPRRRGRSEVSAELEPQDILKFKIPSATRIVCLPPRKIRQRKDALVVMKGTQRVPVVAVRVLLHPGAPCPPWSAPASLRAVEEEASKEGRGPGLLLHLPVGADTGSLVLP